MMVGITAKEPVKDRSHLPNDPENGELRFIINENVCIVYDAVAHKWLEVNRSPYDEIVQHLVSFSDEEIELLLKDVKRIKQGFVV